MRRYLLPASYVLAGLMLCSLGAHVVSCNEPVPTNYGNPNTLDRRSLPGEGGAEPLVCSGEAGAAKYDGGDCPSFANDIFPLMTPNGKWKCSDTTCHGQASLPLINGATAADCYAALQKITVAGKPYIGGDAGSAADLANNTTILCNLQGGCGSRMPKPPAQDPTTAELCMIDAWLKCGAKGR